MPESKTLKAPAKLNIGLEVGNLRPDGYHDISTIMAPLSLHDTIKIQLSSTPGISVNCQWGNGESPEEFQMKGTLNGELPQNEENLCFKAAQLFLEKIGSSAFIAIQITKRIPICSGLGGGSSDAAAVLKGLRFLLSPSMPEEDLFPLALQLGSDVPFFLNPKPVFAFGRGEQVKQISLQDPIYVLLINPGFSVSTAEAYRELDLKLTASDHGAKHPTLQEISLNFTPLTLKYLKGVNNCFESVVIPRYPEVSEIKRSLYNLKAHVALMTGSGPSVFGLF